MARYDVFLVSTLADRAKAELVMRRLRALKFKVRHDKKREHTTPTPKDYRDADNSQSVLVLWSKEACDTSKSDSDWVHAIAHHARSKDGVLLQVGLDKSVPDEPFAHDKRYSLSGMGPRKLVNGYYDLVDELGRRDGRKDLRTWIDLAPRDKEAKEAWKDSHPTDPLSHVKKPATKTKAKPKATPAASTTTAAKAATEVAKPVRKVPPLVINPPKPTPIEPINVGRVILISVALVILCMLVMSASMRTQTGLPATGGASGALLVEQCPPGQIPSHLLDQESRPPLEPGPIIDDTGD
ncbi:MAG: hypothetical protein AAF331_08885 [Pseudomonadota bacterium]